MKTITLPIIVVAILMFAIFLSYHIIVKRRCKILQEAILQNCQEMFITIGELRDLSSKLKVAGNNVLSCNLKQLDDITEKERKLTASMKNTICEAL